MEKIRKWLIENGRKQGKALLFFRLLAGSQCDPRQSCEEIQGKCAYLEVDMV